MNVPYTKQQVQDLPKGLNITRTLIGSYGGRNFYHPNRKERRDAIYGKLKVNNRRNVTGGRLFSKQEVPLFINTKGERVKRVYEVVVGGIKSIIFGLISGFKTLFHKKPYKTINYVR